ncbi:MAG: nitrate ABC transporter substrate-binding protein [Candidatus Aminicenantes bacterium]|nr:nitrate ABC transporter substrate-binding protein [Candidatus Aminicenantes bacterium]NIM79967.1 nitrate ABC transporter substrate-binding protein [Candidatus Aminicenantes bacterium]NIN19306.1 nitrate ABC transporter substrate-binding protein [Candidatus Aminicenantes bacterium]NIN43209.1 nitrate ABC transporter substrate-binding protein [Candidatus Aminicenantes bacterium]NIN85948.1 nitrate ABC transporter substrate-binding protein [Candidatus Aminicenantes bacterium]
MFLGKKRLNFLAAVGLMILFFFCLNVILEGSQELLTPRPISQVISKRAGSVSTSGTIQIPLITWGGDVATIYALDSGIFRSEGLDVSLFLENNFLKQAEGCLAGRTPYLRGTMGMINSAAEVFKKNGIDLVVICQITWSTGGDALVTRSHVKKPSNLKNKTIALQLYGPHMDYVANILQSARVPLNRVTFKWFRELTLPTYDPKGKIVDPVSAFLEDKSIDGVMCIIPDAMNLTSGGKVGTGAAGSVKGARIMLSTKTASRIIADVYAVRSDYFNRNKTKVQAFVRALMKGQEKLQALLSRRSENQSEYKKLMAHAADLLLGAPQATPDVEALLGDCQFVGYDGNVGFFTGRGTTRTLNTLTREIQSSFMQMGLMGKRVTLNQPGWDYNAMAKGLTITPKPEVPKQKFDVRKVQEKISVEPTTWAEEGTLFQIEVGFEPNQSTFPEARYANDFQKALEIAQTYGGSLIIIEGHSDPLGILKAREKRRPAVEIRQMEQQVKNLSLSRARAVRQSFLDYCKRKRFTIDETQFVAVGMGIANPKYNPPRTKEEWDANRRVVFRIKQVEAELTEFSPLKK